jgi:hypothetical protein
MRSKAQRQKVSITARALTQRINRSLDEVDEKLMARRAFFYESGGVRQKGYPTDTGRYYTVNTRSNFLVHSDIDLEAYGRELGVLADWEELADEEA